MSSKADIMKYLVYKKFAITYIVPMKLRNHLKQHRARLDLTQEDLARRVGVRRQTILAIEKGKFVPSALLAFQLAAALGMPVAELFELEGGDRHDDG